MSKLKPVVTQNQNSKIKTFKIKIKKGEKEIVVIDQSGEYIVELAGEGAEALIVGAFVGRNENVFDVRTIQYHKAKNTKSDLLLKSVLFNKSKFFYRGLIKIEKGADGADAYQKNENLLFGNSVSVDSEPNLEIKANSVRCTHGVTTGQVDDDSLFYLRSRGFTEREANTLLISAFFESLFLKVKESKLKEKILRRINFGKLNSL